MGMPWPGRKDIKVWNGAPDFIKKEANTIYTRSGKLGVWCMVYGKYPHFFPRYFDNIFLQNKLLKGVATGTKLSGSYSYMCTNLQHLLADPKL